MEYKRILIIDDSSTSRMIIKRCFEIAGLFDCTYFEANNGIDALAFLDESLVDLIITDINMPKMDGKTLIKKLRQKESTKSIPILVVSSLSDEFLKKEFWDQTDVMILKKPISPEKIASLLEVIP